MFDCRLIVDAPLIGTQNMARDEALLLEAIENGVGTLRYYTWSEPTLSLGYFQPHDDRRQHAASRDAAIVRRQSGGGAILHDRELTYSLCLPAGHPLARHAEQLYTAVHEAFIAELQPLVADANPPWHLFRNDIDSGLSTSDEPFLCFQRRARGDVLLTQQHPTCDAPLTVTAPPAAATKILGSAQRRHRGAILQHGSLLLESSPLAPELAGWEDMTGDSVSLGALISALTVRVADAAALRFFQTSIPHDVESNARQLANNKYGAAAWTNRR